MFHKNSVIVYNKTYFQRGFEFLKRFIHKEKYYTFGEWRL